MQSVSFYRFDSPEFFNLRLRPGWILFNTISKIQKKILKFEDFRGIRPIHRNNLNDGSGRLIVIFKI
jgi:hypothetical protein